MLIFASLLVYHEDGVDVALDGVVDEVQFIRWILLEHLSEDAPGLIYILGAVGSGLLEKVPRPVSDSACSPQHALYLAPSTVIFRQSVEVVANLSAMERASHRQGIVRVFGHDSIMVAKDKSIEVSVMGKNSSIAPIKLVKYPLNITRCVITRPFFDISADCHALHLKQLMAYILRGAHLLERVIFVPVGLEVDPYDKFGYL